MKKQPEQTKETRKKLMEAFWSLYQKKDLNKITIGEITRIAKFNRGTFYEYFIDIYDVLNQIEDELLSQIKEEILETFHDGLPEDIKEYSLRCTSLFKKYEDRLFLLLGPSGDSRFGVKFRNIFLPTFTSIANITNEIPHYDYVMSFIFSALVGMMTHWYENGKDIPEGEFISILQRLVASAMMGYTNIPIFKELYPLH